MELPCQPLSPFLPSWGSDGYNPSTGYSQEYYFTSLPCKVRPGYEFILGRIERALIRYNGRSGSEQNFHEAKD